MQKFLIGMAAAFGAAAALGVTLDELNVARDPENLDGVIYGKAVYNMNFRAGPGKHFATLGTVPGGTEVPVLGWITEYVWDGEFWIRTEYEGKRGWLCGHSDGERLIEREGGPLFPMEVKAAELRFGYTKWLHKGDKLEFASMSFGYLEADAESIFFRVQHDGVWDSLCAYASEEYAEYYSRTVAKEGPSERPAGWFVDFPPEFLKLNFDYNYEGYDLEFADGAAYPQYYLGPGFEFPRAENVLLHESVIFVEGPWALVRSVEDWSWVYLGTEEKPNVQVTEAIRFKELKEFPKIDGPPLEDVFDGYWEGEGKRISLYHDIWPSSNALYIRFSEPYFSQYIGNVAVKRVDVYQPPEEEIAFYSGPPAVEVERWWLVMSLLTYAAELPAGFDFQAPFKMDVEMAYEEAEKFTLTFNCNRP